MSYLKERQNFRCKHRHNGVTHSKCYDRIFDKVGFLDIETEDLNADYGIMLCYAIKDFDSPKIYHDIINKNDIKKYSSYHRNKHPKEDTRILNNLIGDMAHFDRIVGHYSSKFDLPFIRTRATICGVPFPHYGSYSSTDTWRILKSKFKLSRNSLENAHLKLLGFTRKDHLSLSIKHGCLRGEEWALDITLSHCIKDVLDTEDLYKKIVPYVRYTRSSI